MNDLSLFDMCLLTALANEELIQQFDRLTGGNLQGQGTPIDRMIDQATGRNEKDMESFIAFIKEFIYQPISKDV